MHSRPRHFTASARSAIGELVRQRGVHQRHEEAWRDVITGMAFFR
jgi:hypothetical protein